MSEFDPLSRGILIAGLPRTGSTSLAVALGSQGYGPICSHAEAERSGFLAHVQWLLSWIELGIAKRSGRKSAVHRGLKRFLRNCGIVSGEPVFEFLQEIVEIYPSITVITTLRSSSELWYRSFQSTWGRTFNDNPVDKLGVWLYYKMHPMGVLSEAYYRLTWAPKFANLLSQEEFLQTYQDWIKTTRKIVPGDRLIVMEIDEGWEPLIGPLNLTRSLLTPIPHLATKEEALVQLEEISQYGFVTLLVYLIAPFMCYKVFVSLRLI